MIIFALIIFGLIPLSGVALGLNFVLSRKKPRLQIDYKKINQLEWELGLGHSDYGDKGLDIATKAAEAVTETDKIIEDLEDGLNPGRKQAREFKKKVASPLRIPSHSMGPTAKGVGLTGAVSPYGLTRFNYPDGDLTYDGPHGLSCPCVNCYGEIQRRAVLLNERNTISNSIVSDLRKNTRVGGKPLADPIMIQPMDSIQPVEIVINE